MLLDISASNTLLWEQSTTATNVGPKNYTPSYLGWPTGKKQAQPYTFVNGISINPSMEQWADQTCIAKLCMPQYPFWINSAPAATQTIADGVIGLANANTTFPQQMDYPLSKFRNKIFTLSYDSNLTRADHIFTLGGIDKRYVPDGAETKWAKSVGAPKWALSVASATFGQESFDFGIPSLNATLSNTIDEYFFPLAFFDRVTNYFIYLYPEFDRGHDFTIFWNKTLGCPADAPDLLFNVLAADNSTSTIPITIKASSYLSYDNKAQVCNVLFKPATSDTLLLGDKFFHNYVVSFDPVGAITCEPPKVCHRIGFTDRLQTPIPKSVEELLMEQI